MERGARHVQRRDQPVGMGVHQLDQFVISQARSVTLEIATQLPSGRRPQCIALSIAAPVQLGSHCPLIDHRTLDPGLPSDHIRHAL